MSHDLCCDDRFAWSQKNVDIVSTYGKNAVPTGFAMFVTLGTGGAVSFAVTHCPWCGTELDLGAEGADEANVVDERNGRLPLGSLVVAIERIEDTDADGKAYLHAEPGDLGVVLGYYDDSASGDRWPTIAWDGSMAVTHYASEPAFAALVRDNAARTTGFGVMDCEVGRQCKPFEPGMQVQTKRLQRDGSRKQEE